jgi:hypothetical protein
VVGGEPVWVTAEKAGLPSAILFWPGSEAAIHGVRPRRFLPYDEPMTASARVDGVIAWLREPDADAAALRVALSAEYR